MLSDTGTSDAYAQLASALIARHIRTSVLDIRVRDWLAEQKLNAYPIDHIESRMRCIIVVGAGASVPLLARSGDLALKLEGEFGRDANELERLRLVNNLDPDAFETRLIALSKTPDAARRVKETIAHEYNIRYPTVLAYELIAHLLKHRFADAIISFNFDELLDRSLDDELSANEYRTIVSERDCGDVQADADARDYVPLYVKLHGTASEPDSLRLTPDSYYTLPARMVNIVQDLLHADRCLIVNAGSGLASFDFQRLLGIPQALDIYDLSYAPLDLPVRVKIDDERRRAAGLPLRTPDQPGGDFDWLHSCANEVDMCDAHLERLCTTLERETERISSPIGQIAQFRSIGRHQIVASMLGPKTRGNEIADVPRWSSQKEVDYLRKRAIVELAFAGAKARGLLSLVPLSRDRPARYYDLYQQRNSGHGESWTALCSAAGLVESDSIPDVLESAEYLRREARAAGGGGGAANPTQRLHEFRPDALAEHVARRIKNPSRPGEIKALSATIAELQSKADVELHTQDDRVCSKAFKQPLTLKTATALRIYTWLMLDRLEPSDHVYMSAETGGWLLDEPISELLKGQRKLKVLLGFDIDVPKLRSAYPGRNLKLRTVNPWHHNRHMTIVCKGKTPSRAIYFARHLRTPIITAVYLDSIRDVAHLMRTFSARWDEADKVPRD
jgi:hypothetical protein